MPQPTRARHGFTLVELLVVIGIIVVLMGLVIPAVYSVRRSSERNATRTLLDTIGLALESYSNDFGDYPPSDPKALGIKGNGVNDGVECMLRCLTTDQKNGPYLTPKDGEQANLDGDQLRDGENPTSSVYTTPDLHEIVDRSGNPIVYLHNADYDRGATVGLTSGQAHVPAGKSEVTGQYQALTKFQLWSAGPDGVAGTEDDVTSYGE